ncbi:unnamed protein product [Cladocopium goreaui]|uniref:Uncharacterized protein n=1 Tax=Cladocopium goreaui TaxID=2562237 RepID=A0A9P1GRB4_9DINO|nr:unnamed protein product [Cladocopium goreaui]
MESGPAAAKVVHAFGRSSPSSRLKQEFIKLSSDYRRLMELIERSEPELVAELSPNFSPRSHSSLMKPTEVEGPRVSPRSATEGSEKPGQLLAVWPPIRRAENWELQELRAECAKLVRKHQEDQHHLEDVRSTVAEVRQHVEQLRFRVEESRQDSATAASPELQELRLLAGFLRKKTPENSAAKQVPRPGSFTPEPQRAARLPRAAATEAPELRGVAPQLGTPRSFWPEPATAQHPQPGTPRSFDCKTLTPTSWHSFETPPTPSTPGLPSPRPPKLHGARPPRIQEPQGRPERPPVVAVECRTSPVSSVLVACRLCAKQLCSHRGLCYPATARTRQKDHSAPPDSRNYGRNAVGHAPTEG